MKKMRGFVWVLLLAAALLLGGCTGDDNKFGDDADRLSEIVTLTAKDVAALQPGDVADITVTPEMRLCVWEAANMDLWFHLPEFTESQQPTEVWNYWFLVMTDNVTGLDESGLWVTDSHRWPKVQADSEYGSVGMPIISKTEVDEFVKRHFGDVELKHEDGAPKMYDFDGENYYGLLDAGFPQGLFGLQALTVEKREDGIMAYEAKLVNYEQGPPYATQTTAALEAIYGDELAELNSYQLMTDAVINGKADGFGVDEELTVKFYIDETGHVVYLAVDRA